MTVVRQFVTRDRKNVPVNFQQYGCLNKTTMAMLPKADRRNSTWPPPQIKSYRRLMDTERGKQFFPTDQLLLNSLSNPMISSGYMYKQEKLQTQYVIYSICYMCIYTDTYIHICMHMHVSIIDEETMNLGELKKGKGRVGVM